MFSANGFIYLFNLRILGYSRNPSKQWTMFYGGASLFDIRWLVVILH
jgi:hypothetical protein